MRRVGIRELRQNASKYVALVKAGETLEVTERGVPVALLTPPPTESPKKKTRREELIEQGLLIPAKGDWRDVVPVQPLPGAPSSERILNELREERL